MKKNRIETKVRMCSELREAVKVEAERQDRSINWIVCKAIEEFVKSPYRLES